MYKIQAQRRIVALLAVFILLLGSAALAESYTATTMRLLRYEGAVEIEDESGNPRFIMPNARFNSGEAIRTGSDGSASIGLDGTKILTMDANSRVAFARESNALRLTLTEGSLMLDVQKKLNANESLEIETATMLVGIRGTIVYVNDGVAPDGTRASTLGVLEGTAQLHYVDQSGTSQVMPVPAGQVAVVKADREGAANQAPEISQVAVQDLPGFVQEALSGDDVLRNRVEKALDTSWRADGDWTWSGAVTLVAQSASKLYDGAPLTRTGDVLVYGLPASFSIHVAASGSQTDAGSSANSVSSYSIYNSFGENVTSHFTNIETVSGQLVVDPAPLTVWTGSAEKVYDGTPLTNPETELSSVPGYEKNTTPWRNTSYVSGGFSGAQTLYALCGSIWVHGTNPLTGETREIQLNAGQKMEVQLNDDGSAASIELKVENASVDEIPDDVLRVYADNPELLAQACADAGWDPEALQARISMLSQGSGATVNKDGLKVAPEAADRLMRDSTNVRITVDSDITSYNNRALGSDEARFTPVHIDAAIAVTATGSQTEVGESPNTYEIDWGGVNPGNYILSEELGTLTVLAPETIDDEVTLTAASASKIYDGKPLTDDAVKAEGLPDGYTVEAEVTGSITDAGTAENTITSYRILDAGDGDVTDQFTHLTLKPGTLTVEPLVLNCDLGGKTSTYDGRPFSPTVSVTYGNGPHAGETVALNLAMKRYAADADIPSKSADTVQRFPLFTGDVVLLTLSGGGSDAGTHTIGVSLTVPEGKAIDFTPVYTNIEYTIEPAALTVTTGSATKAYDGQSLTKAEATLTGLVEGDAATVTATGSITDVGTTDNTYSIDWGDTNPANYTVTENLGTLEVTANDAVITLTAGSAEKTYDGKQLTKDVFTVTGLPEGMTVQATVTGSRTDAGTGDNTITAYQILNGETDVTAYYTNVATVKGTLTVNPAALTVATGSATQVYNGNPLTKAEATLTGLVEGDAATVAATGSITDVGTTDNTYSIDWGDVNPDNYTVTENLGALVVTPLKLTFDLGGHTAEYDGDPQMPNGPTSADVPSDGITVVTDDTERDVGTSATFTLPGGSLNISVMGFEDAGTHTLLPEAEFLSGKAENYELVYENQAMIITPMKVTVTLHDGSDLTYNGEEQLGNFSATGGGFDIGWTVDGERGFTWGSDQAIVTVTGGGRNAGSYTLAGSVAWESGSAANYDVTITGTAMTIVPAPLTIATSDDIKEYDGQPLTGTATITGLMGEDTATVTATGTITDVGTTSNPYTIDWGDTNAANYTLTESVGTLEVTKNYTPIGLGVNSDDVKTYNGSIQTAELLVVDLPAGLTVWADIAGGGKEVGTYPCSVGDYKIYKGEQDVTANFEAIYKENGSVTITRVTGSLGVTGTYEYDGKVHYGTLTADCDGNPTVAKVSDTEWTVTWPWGDSFSITLGNGSAEVGDHTISLERTFASGTNEDNYIIIAPDMDRVVTITPNSAVITVTVPSRAVTYSGETVEVTGSCTVTGAPDNVKLITSAFGGGKDAGTYETDANYVITNTDGDVLDESAFNVTLVKGTVTISPAPLTITTASAKKVYDGAMLTDLNYTVDGLVGGEDLLVVVTGQQTEVGSSPNTYTINWSASSAKQSNYTVTSVLGTLEVEAPETSPTYGADATMPPEIEKVDEPTPAPSATAEPEPTPAQKATVQSEPTPAPSATAEPEPTPAPSASVDPEHTPAPDAPVTAGPEKTEPSESEPVPSDDALNVAQAEEPASEPEPEKPDASEKPAVPEKIESTPPEEVKPEEPIAQTPKPEEAKAEAPQADTPDTVEHNTEAPKAEETKAEAPQTEPVKSEEAKAEAPKVEETPRPDASQSEAPKAEAPKVEEAPKTEAHRTESPASETPQTEPSKSEAPKAEASEIEAPSTKEPSGEN